MDKQEINLDLYDEEGGYEADRGLQVASALTEKEREMAIQLYKLFNGLWGVLVIYGEPGAGKDLFGNFITHTLKRYFPWKKILRDERPRLLFGPFDGLFNEQVLQSELKKMKEVAKGDFTSEDAKFAKIDAAADSWVTSSGEVLLKNSVLFLTEFWRYCYNREPFNPMNRTMGAVHKWKRHLDCLIIGTIQLVWELDKRTALPYIDWRCTCTKTAQKDTFVYYIEKVKYEPRTKSLEVMSDPFIITLDAAEPRTYLGDGKIVIKKPDYKPVTNEERIVLYVIKQGYDVYEDLVTAIVEHGDMSRLEILNTLKDLKVTPQKRAIDYPCFYGLYNSKSAPTIKSNIKFNVN